MKKKHIIFLCLAFILGLSFGGCRKNEENVAQENTGNTESTENAGNTENTESTENAENAGNSDTAGRSYQIFYEEAPDMVYDAKEWITGDVLHYPEGIAERTDLQRNQRFASYYVPAQALKQASTASLIKVTAAWPFASYPLYDRPSYYIDFVREMFNAGDELWKREDLAETVLEKYEKESFLATCPFTDSAQAKTYTEEAYETDARIVLEELLLASNETFEQMDEDGKERTLKAVEEKEKKRGDENYITGTAWTNFYIGSTTSSAFYNYILELHENGGSKWYDYIKETRRSIEFAK